MSGDTQHPSSDNNNNNDGTPGLDPALAAKCLSEDDRITDWMNLVKSMIWCSGDVCEAEENIPLALAEARKRDLTINSMVGRLRGGGKLKLAQSIARRALKCGHYDVQEIAAMLDAAVKSSGVSTAGDPQFTKDVPEMYYDRRTFKFWVASEGGVWQAVTSDRASAILEESSPSACRPRDGSLPETQRHLNSVIHAKGVDLAMPLAGYKPGYQRVKDLSVLITRSYTLPEPQPDPDHGAHWRHVKALLSGHFGFGKEAEKPGPADYFSRKIYVDRAALKAGITGGGLATFSEGSDPAQVGTARVHEEPVCRG